MRWAKTASKSTSFGFLASRRRISAEPPAGDLQLVMGRALGADPLRVDRAAADQEVVDRRLRVGPRAVVVAEQELRGPGRLEAPRAQLALERAHALAVHAQGRAHHRVAPRPRVAKPQRRQQVQRRRIRPAVVGGDAHQNVVVRDLGVLDDDVEVAVVVEDAGVEQLVLGVELAAAGVGRHQVVVRERRLRILVERLQVGVRRRRVDVEPVLLGVLAVVALGVVEPEEALLDDRVGTVPERQREAHPLALVADPEQPVLTPAIGARARLIVGEGLPRVASARVVLAHRSPLALGQVRTPCLPRDRPRPRRLQPVVLWGHVANPRTIQDPPLPAPRHPRISGGSRIICADETTPPLLRGARAPRPARRAGEDDPGLPHQGRAVRDRQAQRQVRPRTRRGGPVGRSHQQRTQGRLRLGDPRRRDDDRRRGLRRQGRVGALGQLRGRRRHLPRACRPGRLHCHLGHRRAHRHGARARLHAQGLRGARLRAAQDAGAEAPQDQGHQVGTDQARRARLPPRRRRDRRQRLPHDAGRARLPVLGGP